MALFQVPSGRWVSARVSAGANVYGSEANRFGSVIESRAISTAARYWMGGMARSSSQLSGKETGASGGGTYGVVARPGVSGFVTGALRSLIAVNSL
jgi:hypothetical protein